MESPAKSYLPFYIAGCAVAGLLFGAGSTALDGHWHSAVGFMMSALALGTLWAVPFGLVMFVIGRRCTTTRRPEA